MKDLHYKNITIVKPERYDSLIYYAKIAQTIAQSKERQETIKKLENLNALN